MTLGTRIADLRKAKGLSQEALGALVGVTRQAVSKWESDRTIPDVNNCIAMSRALDIPLAQLLDLEEAAADSAPAEAAASLSEDLSPVQTKTAASPSQDLSPAQTAVLEQLTDRYIKARKKLRRRWRWPALLLAGAAAVAVAYGWEQLTEMNRTIDYLSGELAGLRSEIISGVGDQVQESLEAESSLITDQLIQITAADLETDCLTYGLEVTLKEGTEHTTVQFLTRQENGMLSGGPTERRGLHFSGHLTVPLENDLPVYLLVSEPDGSSRSQLLASTQGAENYVPHLEAWVSWAALEQGGLGPDAFEPMEVCAFVYEAPGLERPLALDRLEVVTFLNGEAVSAYPLDLSAGIQSSTDQWDLNDSVEVPADLPQARTGDELTFALMAEDNYGRTFSRVVSCYRVLEGGQVESLPYRQMELDDGCYGRSVWP